MDQIKLGNTGLSVRVLQYLLGFNATGTFDNTLDKAVRVFQGEYNLKVDGICGPITWGKLAELQKTEKCRTMLVGTNPVRAIQSIVGAAVDGKFGHKTQAAVKAYQKKNGLKDDGIVGILTWSKMLTGAIPVKVTPKQPKDFKQGDFRWGKLMYSKSNPKLTISNNGCGVAAAADVVATWWDATVTPKEMATLAIKNGYCAEGSGTYRTFYAFLANKYKASKFIRTGDTALVKKALLEGAYVVALMGKGYWTGGGHYITAWKYDPATDRIYANDPASWTRTSASAKSFAAERKEYFIFYK
jgi:peptidoglycan hydrolase-like protein with peptidoglycan-binding domain